MSDLDSYDLKILDQLQHDGRMTTIELADRIGLSPTPCARRVRRLEEEGYIDRYVALLDPIKMGVGMNVFVSIRLRSQTSDAFDRFDAAIRNVPEIVGCFLLAGNFDYLLQVRTADVDSFREFMRTRLTAIEGVIETQSSIVLQQLKNSTALPIARKLV